MEKKIGLIFSGGGSRGAYQVGVWKALRETGLDSLVTAVSGCSVGSLTASMFVQNAYDALVEVWSSLKKEDVLFPRYKTRDLPIDIQHLGQQVQPEKAGVASMFSWLGLLQIADKYTSFADIKKRNLDLYIAVTDITTPTGHPDYITPVLKFYRKEQYGVARYISIKDISTKEDFLSALLASCAIPGIYSPVKIKGIEYYDGGLAEKHPLEPLLQTDCTDLLLVSLYDAYHLPSVNSCISKNQHKNWFIIHPNKREDSLLTSSTDYDSIHFQYKFDSGYQDALPILEQMTHM